MYIWEFHRPNWRAPSFFRGVGLNHQPDSVGAMGFHHQTWMDFGANIRKKYLRFFGNFSSKHGDLTSENDLPSGYLR